MHAVFSLLALLVMTSPGLAASLAAPANALAGHAPLQGTYVGLRHGESVPSSERRICSSLAAGVDPRNGLTPKGDAETRAATEAWLTSHTALVETALRAQQLIILSSPFSRTRESAALIAETIEGYFQHHASLPPNLLKPPIRLEPDLRERNFGRYEGQLHSDLIYPRVWAHDAQDPAYTGEEVESALAVQRRVTAVVARLEAGTSAGEGWVYLLVSHGDPLKILATGFNQSSAATHQDAHQVPPFRTAEIRVFRLATAPVATP